MRVIGGRLGGLRFDAPSGHATHPMSEKVRGALFNSLGDISGASVLDAFAGSGAIGLEAASRGATSVVSIEQNVGAHKILKRNIEKLGVEGIIKAVRANCSGWSDNNSGILFDIIICDPPYDKLNVKLLSKLTKHLNREALMILSYPGRLAVPLIDGVVVVNNRSYGDAALATYRLK